MITNETGRGVRSILYGLSSDSKPSDLPNASTFFEMDTSKKFWFDSSATTWYEDTSGGGGGGGGGETVLAENDVTFYNHDGSVAKSYSANEFKSLESLPDNPTFPGLTAQGWNWTLEGAKEYVQNHGSVEIGQTYITNDGKTRIYVRITDATKTFMLCLNINGNVSVDWGDGTTSTMIGANYATVYSSPHTYAQTGNYIIKLVVSGKAEFTGNSTAGSLLISSQADGSAYQCKTIINKIEIGENMAIARYGLSKLYSLRTVSIPLSAVPDSPNTSTSWFDSDYSLVYVVIPSSISLVQSDVIRLCTSLVGISFPEDLEQFYGSAGAYCIKKVSIPDGVTSFGGFNSAYALKSINLSNSVKQISASTLYLCYSLESITIPASVLTIGSSAFYRCFSMKEIHFKGTVPPTVSASTSFDGPTYDCIIYVPYSADHSVLNAYKNATNYPDPEKFIYVEE